MPDLSFKSSLVESLARATADVVQHVLQALPPETAEVLLPALLARKTTVIVSVRTYPFQVAGHVQAVDPDVDAAPVLLFEIKGPEAATELYDQRN
jgi:hypothetical protein